LQIRAHDVTADPSAGVAHFVLDLNRTPVFSLTDEYGRQADGFQVYIDTAADPRPFSEFNINCVVRGIEICRTPGELRIRNAVPPAADDPDAGGWGATRGAVPFALAETQISFAIPFSLLRETDGHFNYRWEVYEFGATSDLVQGQSTLVPEPAFSLLSFGALALLIRRRPARPPRRARVKSAREL
jgi:hypothetical protein